MLCYVVDVGGHGDEYGCCGGGLCSDMNWVVIGSMVLMNGVGCCACDVV